MKIFIKIILIIIVYNFISWLTVNYTEKTANSIVENIELYKMQNWNYPKNLDKLVPKYYKTIPIHYSSIDFRFHYILDIEKNNYIFYYTYQVPFWKNTYNSTTKKWNSIN